MNRYYCVVDSAPVRARPAEGAKLSTLLRNQQVGVLGATSIQYNGKPTTFYEVELLTGVKGFVYSGFLDPMFRSPANTQVLTPTSNPYDAYQYVVLDNKVQYNLCGFFCMLHALKLVAALPIEFLLEDLTKLEPTRMAQIMKKNNGLTGAGDLIYLIRAMNYLAFPLTDAFVDAVSNSTIFTAHRLESLLADNRVIIGVSIDPRGRLNSRGKTRHWVVVTSVAPVDVGGVVEIYNPFHDNYEAYGFDEFASSVGIPSGVLIPISRRRYDTE